MSERNNSPTAMMIQMPYLHTIIVEKAPTDIPKHLCQLDYVKNAIETIPQQ
jgi:hypothetical protein